MNAQTHQSITVITIALTRTPVSSVPVAPATASCPTGKPVTTLMSVLRRRVCAATSVRTLLVHTCVSVLQDSSGSPMAEAAVRTAISHPTSSSATAIT